MSDTTTEGRAEATGSNRYEPMQSSAMSRREGLDRRRDDPRSRAIDALTRAGRSDEVIKIIDAASTSAQNAYKAIEDDADYNDAYKAEAIEKHYAGVKEALTNRLVALARDADADDQRDATRVFGTAGLPGDSASLAISSRDAEDRVYSTSSEDLRNLLERAHRMGDQVLARAVVRRAIDEGASKVVKDFCGMYPELDEAVERLWNRSRRTDGRNFNTAIASLGIVPQRKPR